MASSGPGLLTIPREIRDKIWELHYVKNKMQDPVVKRRSAFYPHMKSAIYLTNRQLCEEHKENLLREDKRIDQTIYSDGSNRLLMSGLGIRKTLSYPSLRSYTLFIDTFSTSSIAILLKYMIFVVHCMRIQTVHRHSILTIYVETGRYGIFLGDSDDEAGKDKSSKPDLHESYDYDEEDFAWKGPEKELHFGSFSLKADVYELSLLECMGDLVAPLEVEKRAQQALDGTRDSTESDGRDLDRDSDKWTFKQYAGWIKDSSFGRA